jgi:hypothetical protein
VPVDPKPKKIKFGVLEAHLAGRLSEPSKRDAPPSVSTIRGLATPEQRQLDRFDMHEHGLRRSVSIALLQRSEVGDWVRPVSGGPTMRIRAINGDTAICDFSDAQGTRTDEFPIAQLIFVAGRGLTSPPLLEPRRYRPCPAEVIMSNGRHTCLG